MTRFDKISERRNASTAEEAPAPITNGTSAVNGTSKKSPASDSPSSRKRESSAMDDLSEEDAPSPRKKVKKAGKTDDAVLAARLQAEENSRARPTRGGANTSKKVVRHKKKKSSTRVRASDDSDIGSGGEGAKEVKRTGAFHVRFTIPFQYTKLIAFDRNL